MSPDEIRPESTVSPDAAPERPRYWIVGLALLALVLAVLAGAVLLDRRARPHVGIDPTAAITAAAQATRGPVAERSPTMPVGAVPTAAGASPTPSATASPSGPSAASSPTERQIEEAYRTYLRIYSDAVLNLDTSRLSEVLDGRALQLVTDEVNELKSRGRPVKIVEDERTIAFARVTETSATLVDEYTSRSVYVDPRTMQPLPRTGPPTRVRQSYEFRRVGGVWKIVDGTREVLTGDSR